MLLVSTSFVINTSILSLLIYLFIFTWLKGTLPFLTTYISIVGKKKLYKTNKEVLIRRAKGHTAFISNVVFLPSYFDVEVLLTKQRSSNNRCP